MSTIVVWIIIIKKIYFVVNQFYLFFTFILQVKLSKSVTEIFLLLQKVKKQKKINHIDSKDTPIVKSIQLSLHSKSKCYWSGLYQYSRDSIAWKLELDSFII